MVKCPLQLQLYSTGKAALEPWVGDLSRGVEPRRVWGGLYILYSCAKYSGPMHTNLPTLTGSSVVHYRLAGSAPAALPECTNASGHALCSEHQSSSPHRLQQAALLRPVQSNFSAPSCGSDRTRYHCSPPFRQPQASLRPPPSSLSAARCSIKSSMTPSSPCYRSSAAPMPWYRPEALSAGRSASRRKHRAGRLRRVSCRARRMSTEEACALLGIRGTCSREELRAAYLALIKEV